MIIYGREKKDGFVQLVFFEWQFCFWCLFFTFSVFSSFHSSFSKSSMLHFHGVIAVHSLMNTVCCDIPHLRNDLYCVRCGVKLYSLTCFVIVSSLLSWYLLHLYVLLLYPN